MTHPLVRALLCLTIVSGVACGSRAGAPAPVDCGSSDGSLGAYDLTGRECVWNAYVAQQAVRWSVAAVTIEGDPIPSTIAFDPGQGIVVTRDVRADRFSSTADRRIWEWRCQRMGKRSWATDPSRYSFELTDCSGGSGTTLFP